MGVSRSTIERQEEEKRGGREERTRVMKRHNISISKNILDTAFTGVVGIYRITI